MKFLRLFGGDHALSLRAIVVMAAISGVCDALLLVIINRAAELGAGAGQRGLLLATYLVTFVLYVYGQRYAYRRMLVHVEKSLHTMKLRIANKVRRVELRYLEEVGGSAAFAALTRDSGLVAQAAQVIVTALQASLVVVICLVYIAWLSPISFVFALLLFGLAVPPLLAHYRVSLQEMQATGSKENTFFESFASVLAGFKQIKLNGAEARDIYANLTRLSEQARDLKAGSTARLMFDGLVYETLFYLLLLIVVFILPIFSLADSAVVSKLTATLLFLLNPFGAMLVAIPVFVDTEVALDELFEMERRLDAAQPPVAARCAPVDQFSTVAARGLGFSYRDVSGRVLFTSGPHDFVLRAGETVFLVGGNGAGKSTLLKLLAGLYVPDAGELLLNGAPVRREEIEAYRSLFAVVFADFHLFDRLYGMDGIDADAVRDWLNRVDLAHKTDYVDGRFTNINLSTGQRKRLAFVVAVLSRRPIFIFDELAADQDPEFRARFYTQMLPELKARGHTLIIVSHDERYFHCADRILRLDGGRVVDVAASHDTERAA
ncbi:MAG: cyclic peptide export ABC transporter [Rhodocyclaceae bacterium]|nr:cyclic peptide export ABC transporter [Rhodocyclaceae bacterium]